MTIQIIKLQPTNGKQNPLNPLGKETRIHIHNSLSKAIADPDITSIILFGGSNFSAGADITEFSAKNQDPKEAIDSSGAVPSLTDLGNLIESCRKPVRSL
jgi:enoyl-CoA hydratase/carnithine racemase